jgi:guanylate kinase
MNSKKEQSGQLFVVSAPSGAGKTSLVRALMDSTADISVAISHTTRPMRPEEKNGVNYHFVTVAEFEAMIKRGEFLEWATVFGHLYGTSRQSADYVLARGNHLILEIDWQGAAQIRQQMVNAQSIFIFPPSLTALRDRLDGRAQDDDETVKKRMDAVFQELSHWAEFDYLIVNDNFDVALAELTLVASGSGAEFLKVNRLEALKPLISELLPQKTS